MEAESHQQLLTVPDVSIPVTNIKSLKDARRVKGNMNRDTSKNRNTVQKISMLS